MSQSRFARLALATSLALSPSLAFAESPRDMMLELHGGTYTPEVDSAFEGGATPWADSFGNASMTLFRFHLDYQFWQGFGSLAVGGGAGYGWVDGKARAQDGELTEDSIGFNIAPFSLSLIYRWDWAAVHHNFPLVPYVKGGLSAALWWATDSKDRIASSIGTDGKKHSASGLNWGWHAGVGVMFLLDIFSSSMAANFDNEFGVNNSYLFVEYLHSSIDDFGSDSSLVLSADAFSFGLAFEF